MSRNILTRRANLGYHLWGLMLLFFWMRRWRIQTTQVFESERRAPASISTSILTVLLVAAAIYLGCMLSPPSLMDDVDAVQAQIARNMLTSGDWVTARLDGIVYLEKSPLIYWMIALCYKVFGVFDWVARIPVALSAIALALLTASFGALGLRAARRVLRRTCASPPAWGCSSSPAFKFRT